MVNCRAAMYAAPVGIVNAANPDAAYREAIEIFSSHQTSYGLEAAGVMAACVAEAFSPAATVDTIVATALRLAKEGTRRAIETVVNRAADYSDWRDAIAPLREAIRPHDGPADDFFDRGNRTNDWQPSRLHSIEEVPIALGFFVVTGGDLEAGIVGSANYGRDCDSIAGIAGSISGVLHGVAAIRPAWITQTDSANRCDLRPLAADLTTLTVSLLRRQAAAAQKRAGLFSSFFDVECS